MAKELHDSLRDWAGGVVTSNLPTHANPSTSPHGWNSILKNVGLTGAVPAMRPGFKVVNSGNTSANPGVGEVGQYEYRIVSGGAFTRYHVMVDAAGNIGVIDSDPTGTGTYTNIASTIFVAPTIPDFATANNLCFILNAAARRKLRGLNFELFGIVRPVAAPTSAVGGVGIMNGTFDLRYTFVNGNTGHESSASPTRTQVAANNVINVGTIAVSADTQVTKRNLYVRDQATQTEYRLAATINDNVTTVVANLNVDTSTLTTLGPDTTSNEPPPSTAKYVAFWKNRLFVADDSYLYWSGLNKPEAFDPEDNEAVSLSAGQRITGLKVFADVLLIFLSRSVYVLSGNAPESWRLEPLFTDTGSVAHRSIVEAGGALWWWSDRGPMKWDGSGAPTPIGQLLLGDIDVETSRLYQIQAAVDSTLQLVVWTYPESGLTRNSAQVALNYQIGAFVTNRWDGLEAASLCSVEDNTGTRWLYLGNYNGQVFRFNDATNDAAPSGQVTGEFIASGTTMASISPGAGPIFYNTGVGLNDRFVTIEDSNQQFHSRVRITASTASVLTVALTGLTIGATYTYYVGSPNFEWDTIQVDSGHPFKKQRLRFAFIQTALLSSEQAGMDVFTTTADSSRAVSGNISAQVTDVAASVRFPIGKVSQTWRIRIRKRDVATLLAIYEIGMDSILLTSKLG